MEAEDSIGFRVVHAVRGRTRLRVDSPERLADLAQAIEELFHERPGVRDIRVNADCQSVRSEHPIEGGGWLHQL